MEHKAMVMIPSHKQRQNNASRTHGLTQRQRLQQDRGAAVKKGKQGRVVRDGGAGSHGRPKGDGSVKKPK
ncbi:hypothetical protein V6N11_030669 [Hibiscus sabdariffa]|uniref:Uncharacterized protein n=2 Tax=Hibiscus sabdariffa TaxID=183260 RepID=A0ABR2NME4_9ROSI